MLKQLLALSVVAACSTTSPKAAPVIIPTPVIVGTSNDTVLDLAERRAQVMGWLSEYTQVGAWPTDAAGQPASMFVDANGVRCPMAEIIFRSGRADLVAAVAKENNFVRLADVHTGPLHDWMLGSGLTMEEINLVQGIMNNDMSWMNRELHLPGQQIMAMRAQVRGKLETAQIALRDNTATSLARAAKRLPAKTSAEALVHSPLEDSVVPQAALSSAPPVLTRAPSVRR